MLYNEGFQVGGVTPKKLADENAPKEAKVQEVMDIVAGVTRMDPHTAKPLRDIRKDFAVCRNITRTFREHQDSSAPMRELAVLQEIYPARLDDIEKDDLFAGRFSDGIIGHSAEIWGGFVGFYMLEGEFQRLIDANMLTSSEQEDAQQMIEFWREHATHNIGYREAYQALIHKKTKSVMPTGSICQNSGISTEIKIHN